MTLEELYKDLHSHPELAFAEHRTAGIAAEWLAGAGYTVTTGIGGTGVAGVLRNGDGPTVLVRADMDALPLREETGLDYASATAELAATTDTWRGTLIAVFQPAEEIGAGARAMLDDGLFDKTGVPDLVLGQHVIPQDPGSVLYRSGPFLAAAETWDVTLYGRGGHGSRPQETVDPVVMAASAVLRLQTLVAREIAPADRGVVTVSRLRAGQAENVIPDTATITLDRTREIESRMGSEDFGYFGTAAGVPSCFWDLGCAADGSPGNHSPQFAPQIYPTLPTGVNALVTAVRAVLPVT